MKMKNKISKVWIITGILIFALLLAAIFRKYLTDLTNEQGRQDAISKVIEYMLDLDSFDYEPDVMQEWQTEEKEQLLLSEETARSAEVNFIRGSLAVYNVEYLDAIEYFKKSIEDFTTHSDIRLKARTYYELSKVYIYEEQYAAAIEAADQMEKLYEKRQDKDYLIELNLLRAYDVLEMPDGVDMAVEIMEDTYKMAQKSQNVMLEQILFHLAVAYEYQGNRVKAMNYKIEALTEAEKNMNNRYIMKISTDIGLDYIDMKNYDKSIAQLNKAYTYKLDDPQEDIAQRSYILNNLALAYMELGDYVKSEECLSKQEEIIEQMQEGKRKNDDLAVLTIYRAQVKLYLREIEAALNLLDQAREIFENSESFYYRGFEIALNILYGKVYYEDGEYEKALDYFKWVEEEKLEMGLHRDEDELNCLYKIYKALGKNEEAYQCIEQLLELKDSIYITQERQQADFLVEKFGSEQREKKINTLEVKNREMKMIVIVVSITLMIILTASVMIFKQNKEIKRLNTLFKNLSEIDGLTQVANRRALEEFLDTRWKIMLDYHKQISIAMIDIDFFKKYNDYYGHPAGDEVLQTVAKVLKDNCRETDFVARYGGEEFILIMPHTKEDNVIDILKHIEKEVKEKHIKHECSEVSDYVTMSIGVATTQKDSKPSYEVTIQEADNALYKAKKVRNTIVQA